MKICRTARFLQTYGIEIQRFICNVLRFTAMTKLMNYSVWRMFFQFFLMIMSAKTQRSITWRRMRLQTLAFASRRETTERIPVSVKIISRILIFCRVKLQIRIYLMFFKNIAVRQSKRSARASILWLSSLDALPCVTGIWFYNISFATRLMARFAPAPSWISSNCHARCVSGR